MSLWTPGGEHPVDRGAQEGSATPTEAPGAGPAFSPEQEAEAQQMAAEMQAVREQLAQVPAAQVVANHAMGCWELAAIHLSAQPPKFDEAQVAIDAFGALTEVLKGRLGPDEATLHDALAQLRLAFVQMKAGQESGGPSDGGQATDSGAADTPATPASPEGGTES